MATRTPSGSSAPNVPPSWSAVNSSIPSLRIDARTTGIALFTADQLGGTLGALDPLGVLVAVYLAGLLLPCLVTAFTVAREVSPRYTLKLMARQAIGVVGFSLLIEWGGELLV